MRVFICFLLGAGLYVLLELFWRGYSHISMAAAGGVSLSLLYGVFTRFPAASAALKCLLGAIVITSVEFITGYFVNVRKGLSVWDYSLVPLNLYGQVCLRYSTLWAALTVPASILIEIVYTFNRV